MNIKSKSKGSNSAVEIADLHRAHPRLRAKDWRSPLVKRLIKGTRYRDGSLQLDDSFRAPGTKVPIEQTLSLCWTGLRDDFKQAVNTYQEPVITEYATLGIACILLTQRAALEITEVTRRGEKADYWLGDREFMLEVSGQQTGDLAGLCSEKAAQLLQNPFNKPGYVCVANYDIPVARLWFYDSDK